MTIALVGGVSGIFTRWKEIDGCCSPVCFECVVEADLQIKIRRSDLERKREMIILLSVYPVAIGDGGRNRRSVGGG